MLSKKCCVTAALSFMILSFGTKADAYGLTWFDKDYDFSKLGQVLLVPADNKAPYGADANLLKESKAVKTVFFAADEFSGSKNTDKKQLAKQIKDKTGADAFLVAEIVTNEDQRDYIDGRYFPVTMHDYTEVSGPDGKHIERERYHDTQYYYSGREVNLHKLEVDFHLYNCADGKRIYSFNDVRRSYNYNQETLFKDIVKEFFSNLKDTAKQAEKVRNRKLNIDSITLNGKINETDKGVRLPCLIEALGMDLSLEGAKTKNVLVSDKGESNYILKAAVFNYYDSPYWREPFVNTSDKLVRSWSEKRKVRQEPEKSRSDITRNDRGQGRPSGEKMPAYKEVTIEHKQYRTEVSEYNGGYDFKAQVTLNAEVVDKNTGKVVFRYSNTKSNDKRADAWKALTKDFYKKIIQGYKKITF